MSNPSREHGRDAIPPEQRCSRCGSKGLVWGLVWESWPSDHVPIGPMPCPACAGTGRRRPAPEAAQAGAGREGGE